MSEPSAAMLKLRISRGNLDRWLDAPAPLASRWRDWRALGGQYHATAKADNDLAQVDDAELDSLLNSCDKWLARLRSNRDALSHILATSGAPEPRLSGYGSTRDFLAINLIYSENIVDFIVFLTVSRSAADVMTAGEYGIAVIDNVIWAEPGQDVSGAVRIDPAGHSSILDQNGRISAAAAFHPIADVLLEGRMPDGYSTRDMIAPSN